MNVAHTDLGGNAVADISGEISRIWRLVVLSLLAVVCAPAVFSGAFGVDHDAWGVLSAALQTIDTGQFHISRNPGNPVHELAGLLSTFLVTSLGLSPGMIPTLMNLYSFVAAVAAYMLFFQLQREMGVNRLVANLASTCLIAGPSVLIHAADGMDYLPALAFGLAALRYRNHSPLLVIVLFNLAVGNRIQLGAFIVPLAFLYWHERVPRKQYLTLAYCLIVAAAVRVLVALLAAPAPDKLGSDSLDIVRIGAGLGFGLFGVLGTLFLIGVGTTYLLRTRLVADRVNDGDWQKTNLLFSLSGLLPQLLLYMYVPGDPAIFIPGIPFLLLFVASLNVKSWVWFSFMSLLVLGNLYAVRGFDPEARAFRPYVTPGPYRIALYEHYLPKNVFQDFQALAAAQGPENISLIVQQHGISNSYNTRWGDLWKLHDDRRDIDFTPTANTRGPFTATQWNENTIYVLRKSSPTGNVTHTVSDADMEALLREICAREADLGHRIFLDADYSKFVGACESSAGTGRVQAYSLPSKRDRLDHSWMSF